MTHDQCTDGWWSGHQVQGWLVIRGAVIISWMARDRCPDWLVERSSGVGWLVISVFVERSSDVDSL